MASSSTSTTLSESGYIFSPKRYYINNLDSYHGAYIVKEISKIIAEKNVPSPKQSSRTLVGEDVQVPSFTPPEQPYEIIGTVTNPKLKSIDNVARFVPKEECVPQMLTCGTVILDISYDRDELKVAMDYMNVLKELIEKQKPPPKDDDDEPTATTAVDTDKRILILISTVMSWGSTKPMDPDNPDMPFIELDFRKRKPHPNYKMHYDIENEVIGVARKYRSQIGALVIATGVTYGGREDVLFYWFQKAWECEPVLPILGRGRNVIPLINVLDLAKIVYNLVVDFPRKLYILAVEQNVTKQREIVKPLGRAIGSGMFKCIPPEDAFLIPEIDQRIFDLMTLNLNMEPTFIVETMGLQWTSELTFGENVPTLMKQFKKERTLKPFKILVYGPPIVGKTTLAKLICHNYGLVYISPETVAQDLLSDLAWRVNHWDVGETAALAPPTGEEEEPVDEDDDAEDEDAQAVVRQTLSILQSGRAPTDEEIMGYLRQKMLSRDAINRGWVLDGFPTNMAQCAALFEKGEEQDSESADGAEHEPFDEDVDLYSTVLKKLLPDIVVSLEATDEFLCDKAMRQPEGDPRFDEETVLKRLNDFRFADSRETTPLNFFDELDIHPLVVPVKEHQDYDMKLSYHNVELRMGRPCRYGKLLGLIEAAEKKEKEERKLRKAAETKALEALERSLKEEREEKMEYWTELYALLREEEEAALAAAGEPMRNYLIHHIFPTLTPALLEVAKLRPEDPVDFLGDNLIKLNPHAKKLDPKLRRLIETFLSRQGAANSGINICKIEKDVTHVTDKDKDDLEVAEQLFKLNPSGKMLEPGYNLQAEKLLGKIKILDDAIKNLDIKIEPLFVEVEDTSQSSSAAAAIANKLMGPL
ncbi:unnamed protein product [Arctia plantaginis]|uniref:Adenylate kinase 7 n=1 Tax=Arctia plantaginis TaxID=874455 RepID=A0A8S1ADA1_ARCPL|nr:unnamed protein product [Arctia plantaginis]